MVSINKITSISVNKFIGSNKKIKDENQITYLSSSIKQVYFRGENISRFHYTLKNFYKRLKISCKKNNHQSFQKQTIIFSQVFINLFNFLYMNHTKPMYLELFLNSLKYLQGFSKFKKFLFLSPTKITAFFFVCMFP